MASDLDVNRLALRKGISKGKIVFVGLLEGTDFSSRIRIQILSRNSVYVSQDLDSGSECGSVSKCHGFGTLVAGFVFINGYGIINLTFVF
jgi:hypothetical protein